MHKACRVSGGLVYHSWDLSESSTPCGPQVPPLSSAVLPTPPQWSDLKWIHVLCCSSVSIVRRVVWTPKVGHTVRYSSCSSVDVNWHSANALTGQRRNLAAMCRGLTKLMQKTATKEGFKSGIVDHFPTCLNKIHGNHGALESLATVCSNHPLTINMTVNAFHAMQFYKVTCCASCSSWSFWQLLIRSQDN